MILRPTTWSIVTYLGLIDADTDGAEWSEVANAVLHIDPFREPERAKAIWRGRGTRSRWGSEHLSGW
jgi:hypothetical protein